MRRDRREELVDDGGDRQPYPELLGGGARQTEILLLQFDHEAGGEVPALHTWRQIREHP